MVCMATHVLTRGEIAELADRLRDLIAMVDNGEMSATKAMRYRLEGGVSALEAVLGHDAIAQPVRLPCVARRCRQVLRGLGGGDVTQTGTPSKAMS